MPGIEDWINGPLDIIQGYFDEDAATYEEKAKAYFTQKLSDEAALAWVPSLNDTPLHLVKNCTLARFRCMIQDMYDPEYYLDRYEVRDNSSGHTCMKLGRFKDIADCKPNHQVLVESQNNKTGERQTLYCVPIPGETAWVKQMYSKSGGKTVVRPSMSTSVNQCKRPLDDESETDAAKESSANGDTPTAGSSMETESVPALQGAESKKTKTDSETANVPNRSINLNFPLPEEIGPACLVKIYEDKESFKVAETVEFIGIISNDPAMVQFPDDQARSSMLGADGENMEGIEEPNDAREPPPSLVPRLHTLVVRRLPHNNPLLPHNISQDVQTSMTSDAISVREQLLSVLEQALLGDKLAAEYMLCHLISSVYARQDVLALGKFSLNLSGCPRNSAYSDHYNKLLQQLLTKCYMFPLTISNLNQLRMSPAKDYQQNRLLSGVLQLSDLTHLVLDETAMQPGQLDAKGVLNLTALGNLVRWQKVEYDFEFHKQDFTANIPVLVLSEGKSLVQCDCQVPLQPTISAGNLADVFSAIDTYLTPALLTRVRSYLTALTLLPYTLPADLQKAIEEDFVTMRKDDPKSLTVEDFHSMLVIARLLSLSTGQSTLSQSTWEHAKRLEIQRRHRIPQGGATAQMA